MGKPRKNATHLPQSMFQRHGAYYFVKGGKWLHLSRDYGAALTKYAELVGSPAKVTKVRDAIWTYIEYCKTRPEPVAASTLEGYRRSAINLMPVFGDSDLSAVEPTHVYQYLTKKGTVQANRDRALLSAAYTHARRIGAFSNVADDPTKNLEYRNPERPRQRYVEDGELAVLLNAASPKLACIARFAFLTGMRQSDALRVRLEDMDDEGIHYAPGKTNKRTGKRLVVLWSPELRACVDEAKSLWRREGREYLFESRPKGKHAKRGPGPYTPSGLRALWRRGRQKAGIVDVRLHDLRRKAGSDLEAGDAQRLLGHTDGKVTARHYRAKADRVKPAR